MIVYTRYTYQLGKYDSKCATEDLQAVFFP